MARRRNKTGRTVRVFAYGSNINPEQMRRRCPSAVFERVFVVQDFRLSFCGFSRVWGGGVANVEPHKGSRVYGVIWLVSQDDLQKLDRFEGAPFCYARVTAIAKGGTFEVYVKHNTTPCEPSTAYVATILDGYRHFRLSAQSLTGAVRRARNAEIQMLSEQGFDDSLAEKKVKHG